AGAGGGFGVPRRGGRLWTPPRRRAPTGEGRRGATPGGAAGVAAWRPPPPPPFPAAGGRGWDWRRSPARPDLRALPSGRGSAAAGFAEAAQEAFDVGAPSADARVAMSEAAPDLIDRPLAPPPPPVHQPHIAAHTRA